MKKKFNKQIFALSFLISILLVTGCLTSEKVFEENALKSAVPGKFGESNKLSDFDKYILNEFKSDNTWKLMLEGIDPPLKDENEFKDVEFSFIPVLSLKKEILTLTDPDKFKVERFFERTNEHFFILGRLNGELVMMVYVHKKKFDKNGWSFTVPAFKKPFTDWAKKYEKKKLLVDNNEIFIIANGDLYYPAFYINGIFHYTLMGFQINDMSERELAQYLLDGPKYMKARPK